jgi:DNA-binding CsgD family transcriptional regulator
MKTKHLKELLDILDETDVKLSDRLDIGLETVKFLKEAIREKLHINGDE